MGNFRGKNNFAVFADFIYYKAEDIATEKQVSIRSHRIDIATGGGANSHRNDIDTGGGTNSHRNDIDTGGGTNSHKSDIDTGLTEVVLIVTEAIMGLAMVLITACNPVATLYINDTS